MGQRVRVTTGSNSHPSFKDCVGTIVEILIYYRVKLDVPINEYTVILCEENELCEYEPTDIMEYLKDRLLERG